MPRNFLTGGVGFLGAATCAHIHGMGEARDWLLLVRSQSEDHARTRLRDALLPHLGAQGAADASGQFSMLAGDLACLLQTEDPRLGAVERIVHLAADTSFTARRSVWAANFDGTMTLAARARGMKRLCRFLYVGTAFRCGSAPHFETVHEADPPGRDVPHLVEYTRSKAATETALHAGFQDLPLVVALPSIVAGHSVLGCGTGSSIFWFFRALDLMARIPCPPDTPIDVVPVDWAARTLLHLATAPGLEWDTYHVSAGQNAHMTLAEMARRFSLLRHGPGHPWTTYDMEGDWRSVERVFRDVFPIRDALDRTMLSAVRLYSRFVAQGLSFDNTRLMASGMSAPPRLTEYMDVCLEKPGTSIKEMFGDDSGAFTDHPPGARA